MESESTRSKARVTSSSLVPYRAVIRPAFQLAASILSLYICAAPRGPTVVSLSRPGGCSNDARAGSLSHLRTHRKLARYQVPNGVAGVRSHGIRLVQFCKRVAVRINLPAYLLQVLDQLLTPRIDPQPTLAGVVAKHGVYAINPILYRRIGAGHAQAGVVAVRVAAKEVLSKSASRCARPTFCAAHPSHHHRCKH
jgi:hypothetical protein